MGTEGMTQDLAKCLLLGEQKVQGGEASYYPKRSMPHDTRPVSKNTLVPLDSLSSSTNGHTTSRLRFPTQLAGKR